MMKRPTSLSVLAYSLAILAVCTMIFQGYSAMTVARIFKENNDVSMSLYRFLNSIIYPVMLIIAAFGMLKGAYWSKIVIYVWLIPKIIENFLSIVLVEFELIQIIQFSTSVVLLVIFLYVFSRKNVKVFLSENLKNTIQAQ